ncbi:helix-turn-helix domain-containing protein, partial [Bacillus thuringiensis]|nr:helix-turn-helix domain-containing protein [Bacillus thuringiensis]MED3146300.1 helix-turn-helix domain-containing protein [Bacillus thuringiensis]
VAKKVQMLRLQEKRNKHEENIEAACAEQLKIKRECIELEKNIAKKRSQKVQTTEEKWDEKCNQAVQLFNQGMEYPTIAKKVGCNVSSLYRELKKRDLLQMPKQVAPCKSVKAPIIPPQTKKSKFERYKEYYMYR